MKTRLISWVMVFALMCSFVSAFGQTDAASKAASSPAASIVGPGPVLKLFRNGQDALLECVCLRPGVVVSIEVASSASGEWTTDSALAALTADQNGTISVVVPMSEPSKLFRVRTLTEAPTGMVLIPAGQFEMSYGYSSITVSVSAFKIDRTEVTKARWDEVYEWATNHGYTFPNCGSGKAPSHPVHSISHADAILFCNARSEYEGLTPVYCSDEALTTPWRGTGFWYGESTNWDAGYRLPTNAEWQKAARGGADVRWLFPWGNTISHSQANYYSRATDGYGYRQDFDISPTRGIHPLYSVGEEPYTSPVGSFAPNGYGLYDMVGNVAEMCLNGDIYHDKGDNRYDPYMVEFTSHGGSWDDWANDCLVKWNHQYEGNGDNRIGFRTVLLVQE